MKEATFCRLPTQFLEWGSDFDATHRFKDVGQLIKHSASKYNIKPSKPTHVRGKWWVGMIAVRDVAVDEELTYNYGVRSEGWMKVKGGGTRRESSGEVQGASTSEMALDREEGERGGDYRTQPKSYKRKYFWCPELDCTSGPVQKKIFRKFTK